jgi:hypothetical protein
VGDLCAFFEESKSSDGIFVCAAIRADSSYAGCCLCSGGEGCGFHPENVVDNRRNAEARAKPCVLRKFFCISMPNRLHMCFPVPFRAC